MIVIFIRVCNNREKDNPAKLILPAKPPSRHTHVTCILTIWLLTLYSLQACGYKQIGELNLKLFQPRHCIHSSAFKAQLCAAKYKVTHKPMHFTN